MPSQQIESKESEDGISTPTVNTKKIGWNVNHEQQKEGPDANDAVHNDTTLSQCSLPELQMSHKQITDRFVELLNLFESYTKIVQNDQKQEQDGSEALALKRTKSEQLIHKEVSELSELSKSSASLMQLSDSTLVACRKPMTSEISCQTSWTLLELNRLKPPKPKGGGGGGEGGEARAIKATHAKPSKVQQHTITIEVESVTSTTALQRAPLRQRLWRIVMQIGDTLMACTFMIGENFTYILFILLCIWCLYLVIGHYYSFLQDNVNRRPNRPVITGNLGNPPN